MTAQRKTPPERGFLNDQQENDVSEKTDRLYNDLIAARIERDSAIIRAQEANANWSKEAQKWADERKDLKAQLQAQESLVKDTNSCGLDELLKLVENSL